MRYENHGVQNISKHDVYFCLITSIGFTVHLFELEFVISSLEKKPNSVMMLFKYVIEIKLRFNQNITYPRTEC